MLAGNGGALPTLDGSSTYFVTPASSFNESDVKLFLTVGTDAPTLASAVTVSTFGSLASTSTAAEAAATAAAAGVVTGPAGLQHTHLASAIFYLSIS